MHRTCNVLRNCPPIKYPKGRFVVRSSGTLLLTRHKKQNVSNDVLNRAFQLEALRLRCFAG